MFIWNEPIEMLSPRTFLPYEVQGLGKQPHFVTITMFLDSLTEAGAGAMQRD